MAFAPAGTRLVGLAVDVGTTKLAGYLVDLATGETLAKAGAPNPQIGYGEDVISRINYTMTHEDGARTLQAPPGRNASTNWPRPSAVRPASSPEQIVEAVIVGNTAMQHLFARLAGRAVGARALRRRSQ